MQGQDQNGSQQKNHSSPRRPSSSATAAGQLDQQAESPDDRESSQSGDEKSDADDYQNEAVRLGKRKRPISVSYVTPNPFVLISDSASMFVLRILSTSSCLKLNLTMP